MGKFEEEHTFEKRQQEANFVLNNYPDRIPIIVEKSSTCLDIPEIDKKKFLAPRDITFGQFQFSLRKRLKLSPEKSFFLFSDNTIMANSQNIVICYEQYKKKDGFMYVTYDSENTFG